MVPELQLTPAAQLAAAPPAQVTSQVDPLQFTVRAHELRPEQRTVLLAAVVLRPAAQERLPLQVVVHWLPEQLMGKRQLSAPAQVIWVVPALLVTPSRQALLPPQAMVHSVPPHLTAPAQTSAWPLWPQVMLQVEPCEQSTPPAHPPGPQSTWQGWLFGQVTTPLHVPRVVQSKTQVPPVYWPPLSAQIVAGVTSGPASGGTGLPSGPLSGRGPPSGRGPSSERGPPSGRELPPVPMAPPVAPTPPAPISPPVT